MGDVYRVYVLLSFLIGHEAHSFTDILSSRDPRRNQPLVDYLTSLVIDPEATEAFNTAKRQDRTSNALTPSTS